MPRTLDTYDPKLAREKDTLDALYMSCAENLSGLSGVDMETIKDIFSASSTQNRLDMIGLLDIASELRSLPCADDAKARQSGLLFKRTRLIDTLSKDMHIHQEPLSAVFVNSSARQREEAARMVHIAIEKEKSLMAGFKTLDEAFTYYEKGLAEILMPHIDEPSFPSDLRISLAALCTIIGKPDMQTLHEVVDAYHHNLNLATRHIESYIYQPGNKPPTGDLDASTAKKPKSNVLPFHAPTPKAPDP